jgi:hypothetical protein
VACLVGNRVPSSVPSCTYDSNAPFVGGQTSESFTRVALVGDADYEVDVEAAFVNPSSGAAYHLDVYVNGVQIDISGDVVRNVNYVHSTDLLCHAQLP